MAVTLLSNDLVPPVALSPVPAKNTAHKGSRCSIQQLINTNNGSTLTQAIGRVDPTLQNIKWLSPLAADNFKEFINRDLRALLKPPCNLDFWPGRGPHWDAVGMAGDTLILVEAKSYPGETRSKMGATSDNSQQLITESMREAHTRLVSPTHNETPPPSYDPKIWEETYYQLGNRLSYLSFLNYQNIPTKFVLVNFVNDPTWRGTNRYTTKEAFEEHYAAVFTQMLGTPVPPVGVCLVYV